MKFKFTKEFVIGASLAVLLQGCAVMERMGRSEATPQNDTIQETHTPTPTARSVRRQVITVHSEKIAGDVPEVTPKPTPTTYKYTITAYCGCEVCCGGWAKNRPNGVVIGAMGTPLKEGYSVASPLPLGTKVKIDGLGVYEVQDRTAEWIVEKYDNMIIDIYFTKHEDIKKIGKLFREVTILK